MAKKSGSEGMTRQTTAEWAADTKLYPERHRLLDTDTGTVRVSQGTTYAMAWVPSGGTGGATLDTDTVYALETFSTPLADAGNPFQTNADLVTLAGNISTVIQNLSDDTDDALALKANAIPTYTATLTQSGTNAPVATVLVNSLGGTIGWSRGSGGSYEATLAGAFPTDARTVIVLDPNRVIGIYANEAVLVEAFRTTSDYITVTFSDSGDGWLNNWFIEIRVYPA